MAIKLAFSTVACPNWTIEQVARQAQQMAYAGVELRTLGGSSSALACDPALTDPKKVRDVLTAFDVEPACLSTSTALHHRDRKAIRAAQSQLVRDLELAAQIGCPYVRIFGNEVGPGEDRRSAIQRIAERVAPLADKGGELGVSLLFENAGSFCGAKEWWWLLNLIEHPMVGLSWNAANAAAIGESPVVSIPTLNSRIQLVKAKDLRVGEGTGFVPLGEGSVGMEVLVKRLLGIGYEGYISVEWDRLWLQSLEPAEQYLPQAHQRLKKWLDDIAELEEQARLAREKAAAKAAAKAAPKKKPADDAATEAKSTSAIQTG